jgi:hypothetical protein
LALTDFVLMDLGMMLVQQFLGFGVRA